MNVNDEDYCGHYSNHDSSDFFVLENSSLELVEEFDREVEDDVEKYTSNVAADVTVGNNYIYHGDVDIDMVDMVEEVENVYDDDEDIDFTQPTSLNSVNNVPISPVTFTDVSEKKSVSVVWDYFKSVDNNPTKKYKNDETQSFQCKCGKVYQYKAMNGTKTLLRHLNEKCIVYKETIAALNTVANNSIPGKVRVLNQSQLIINSSTQGIVTLKMEPFTQAKSRQDLIEMIVVDDMPFTTAERPGFIKYSKGLRPDFDLISRYSVKRDIMKR